MEWKIELVQIPVSDVDSSSSVIRTATAGRCSSYLLADSSVN